MLRIIDMSSVNDTPGAVAVWDTVTDSFLTDSAGEQCWDSMYDIDGWHEWMIRVNKLLPVQYGMDTEEIEKMHNNVKKKAFRNASHWLKQAGATTEGIEFIERTMGLADA